MLFNYVFFWGNWSKTWKVSTVRTWLNNDFYNIAFSSVDKLLIKESQLEYTKDKIFLLSEYEVMSIFSLCICIPTPYSKKINYENATSDSCEWWLRSTGVNHYFCHVMHDNNIIEHRIFNYKAVRPAMRINLKKL